MKREESATILSEKFTENELHHNGLPSLSIVKSWSMARYSRDFWNAAGLHVYFIEKRIAVKREK